MNPRFFIPINYKTWIAEKYPFCWVLLGDEIHCKAEGYCMKCDFTKDCFLEYLEYKDQIKEISEEEAALIL